MVLPNAQSFRYGVNHGNDIGYVQDASILAAQTGRVILTVANGVTVPILLSTLFPTISSLAALTIVDLNTTLPVPSWNYYIGLTNPANVSNAFSMRAGGIFSFTGIPLAGAVQNIPTIYVAQLSGATQYLQVNLSGT